MSPSPTMVVTAKDIVDFPLDKSVMLGIQDMRWMCRNVMAREKVLFPVAAEVMELLARLPSVPEVEPRPPGTGRDDPPAAGSFREALLRAVALEYGT